MCKGLSMIAFSPSGKATTTVCATMAQFSGVLDTEHFSSAGVNLKWHKGNSTEETTNLFKH
jgi:hypothetical protein